MAFLFIILFVVFFVTLIWLLWDVLADDDEFRDELEKDLKGWWEYFNYEDDDDDKTVNGDH